MKGRIKRCVAMLLTIAMTLNSTGMVSLADAVQASQGTAVESSGSAELENTTVENQLPEETDGTEETVPSTESEETQEGEEGQIPDTGSADVQETVGENANTDPQIPPEDTDSTLEENETDESETLKDYIVDEVTLSDEDIQTFMENPQEIPVGGKLEDVKFPEKIILKVHKAEEKAPVASAPNGTYAVASPYNGQAADESGTPDTTDAAGTTAAGGTSDAAVRTETIEIPVMEGDWKIAFPEGAESFDTSGLELTDDEGNPTGERSALYAQNPAYIFVPDLENLRLADETGRNLDMTQMLEQDGWDSLDEYLTNHAAVNVLVGAQEGTTLELGSTTSIDVKALEETVEAEGKGYTYSTRTRELVLLNNNTTYRIYMSDAPITNVPRINIKFGDNVDITELQLEGDIGFGASGTMMDFTGVSKADVIYTGNLSFTARQTAGILVPEGTEVTLTGTGNASLTITTNNSGVGIGSLDGAMGTVNLDGGSVTISASANNAGIGIGSKNSSAEQGNLNVISGSLNLTGPSYYDAESASHLQSVNVNVMPGASYLEKGVSSQLTGNSRNVTYSGGNILIGTFDSFEDSYGVTVKPLTATEENQFEETITLDQGWTAFAIALPDHASYSITGTETSGANTRTFRYRGLKDGATDETVTFQVAESETVASYTNLQKTYLPVFWEDSVTEITLDDSGTGNVTLQGEVDTQHDKSQLTSSLYNKGSLDIRDRGFILYEGITYTDAVAAGAVGYYNAKKSGYDADNKDLPSGDQRDPQSAETTDPYQVAVTGLPSGTYWARPYVLTSIGVQYGDTVYSKENTTNPYEPISVPTTDGVPGGVLKIVVPKITYPESLTYTYGITLEEALNAYTFENQTTTRNGVTITFPTKTDDDPYGSSIEGRYYLYTAPDRTDDVDVTETTLDANDPSDTTNYKQYYIGFTPSENANAYKLSAKPIKVTINKKPLTITGIANDTKVYDGTTDIGTTGDIELEGVIDADQDQVTATATAKYSSANATAEDTAVINLTGITLEGDKSKNYSIAEATTVPGTIEQRELALKAKEHSKWVGEKFDLDILENTEYIGYTRDKAHGLVSGEDLYQDVFGAYSPTKEYGSGGSGASFDTTFFNNVPTQTPNIGEGSTGSHYTVWLNIDAIRAAVDATTGSGNYKIVGTAGQGGSTSARFYFQAEYPTENTNYTLVHTTTSDAVDGWYSGSVTIQPTLRAVGSSVPDGVYPLGYDQVQIVEPSGVGTTGYAGTQRISSTTSGIKIRLRNSTTGAYTYVSQDAFEVKIDTVNPTIGTITYSVENDNYNDLIHEVFGWMIKKEVTVYAEISDTNAVGDASGIQKVEYSLDGTKWATCTTTKVDGVSKYTFKIPDGENRSVQIRAYDKAGNLATKNVGSDGKNLWIVESTAPTIGEFSYNGTTGKNEWYTTPVTVTAQVTDADNPSSGLWKILESVNDGETTESEIDGFDVAPGVESYTYSNPLTTQTSGTTIAIKAVDNARNESIESVTKEIKIDLNDPELTATASTTAWTSGSITINVTAKDDMSGLDKVEYTFKGVNDTDAGTAQTIAGLTAGTAYPLPVSQNGTYTFTATDVAGRTTTKEVVVSNLDTTAPAAPAFTLTAENPDTTDWYNSSVVLSSITIAAVRDEQNSDNAGDVPGYSPITTEYAIWQGSDTAPDDITWQTVTGTAAAPQELISKLTSEGIWYLQARSRDAAGNQAESAVLTVKFDTEAPKIAEELTELVGDERKITYSYKESAKNPVDAIQQILEGYNIFQDQVIINIPVRDDVSDVEKVSYTITSETNSNMTTTGTAMLITDSATGKVTAAEITLPLNTEGRITYTAVDYAGNISEEKKLGVNGAGDVWILENTAPDVTLSAAHTDGQGTTTEVGGVNWFTKPVTVTINANDQVRNNAASGLQSVTYTAPGASEQTKTYTEYDAADTIPVEITTEQKGGVFTAQATDNAGNTETEATTAQYWIDLNAPTIENVTYEKSDVENNRDYTKDSYFIEFDVTDAYSGVKTITVGSDTVVSGGMAQTSDRYTVTGDANAFHIEYRVDWSVHYDIKVIDNVGHADTREILIQNIDKKKPEISSINWNAEGKKPGDNEYYAEKLKVEITAADHAGGSETSENEYSVASGIEKYVVLYSDNKDAAIENWTAATSDDGSSTDLTTDPLYLAVDGAFYYRIAVYDRAGNVTYSDPSELLKISTGSPTLQLSVSVNGENWDTTSGDIKWTNGNVVFTLYSPSDESGMVEFAMKKDTDTGWTVFNSSTPGWGAGTWGTYKAHTYTISEEGSHTYQFRAQNTQASVNGNDSIVYTVKIDKTIPAQVGTVSVDNSTEIKEWYNSATRPEITLGLTESDNGSANVKAPRAIRYNLQKEGESTLRIQDGTTNPFSIPNEDGIWTLTSWVVDAAGNRSADRTTVIRTDAAAPTIGGITVAKTVLTPVEQILNYLSFGNYSNDVLRVTVTVTDVTSKPAKLEYTITTGIGNAATETTTTLINGTAGNNGTTVTYTFDLPVGTKAESITLKAYDTAGNTQDGTVESDTSGRWIVEQDGPTISYNGDTAPATNDGWFNQPFVLTVKSEDTVSGVNNVSWTATVDTTVGELHTAVENLDSETGSTSSAIPLGSNGSYNGSAVVITTTAVDNAGNSTTLSSQTMKIDTVAPVVTITSGNPIEWQHEEAEISFTLYDATSGINLSTLEITKDGDTSYTPTMVGTPTASGGTFTTDGNGTYRVYVEDNAGLHHEAVVDVTRVDTVTPDDPSYTVQIPGEGDTMTDVAADSWITETPTITITVPAQNTASTMTTKYKLWKGDTVLTGSKECTGGVQTWVIDPIATGTANDGTWHLKVWTENLVVDKDGIDGYISTPAERGDFTFSMDRQAPTTGTHQFRTTTNNAIQDILNQLTFGNFFKEKLEVWVPVSDAATGSGIKGLYCLTNETADDLDSMTDSQATLSTTTQTETDPETNVETTYYVISLDVDFNGYIRYWAADNAGNTSTRVNLRGEGGSTYLLGDSTAPQISEFSVVDPTSGDPVSTTKNNWYTQTVTVKSIVTDGGSGLASVLWKDDREPADKQLLDSTDTGKITDTKEVAEPLTADGTHNISLKATDNAGNAAVERAATIKIDTEVPVINVTDGNPDNKVNADVFVRLTVTDTVSGIDLDTLVITNTSNNDSHVIEAATGTTEATLQADQYMVTATTNGYSIVFKVSENANYTIDVEDMAGNAADQVTENITNIDKSGVATATATIAGTDFDSQALTTAGAWYKAKDLTITITNPADSAEGTQSETYYKWIAPDETDITIPDDLSTLENSFTKIDGDSSPATIPIDNNADGTYKLYVFTKKLLDPAEYSSVSAYIVKADRGMPVIGQETGMPTSWTNDPGAVTVPVLDRKTADIPGMEGTDYSGINSVTVTDPNGTSLTVTGPESQTSGNGDYRFTPTVNGTYTVTAIDVAGNVSTKEIKIEWIDKIKPGEVAAVLVPNTPDGSEGYYKTKPSANITPAQAETADGQAPIHTYYFAWTGDAGAYTGEDALRELTRDDGRGEVTSSDVESVPNLFSSRDDAHWNLIVWSQDAAGNICEKPVKLSLSVDTLVPVLSEVKKDPDGPTTGDVTVSFTVTDATSGLNRNGIQVMGSDNSPVTLKYNTDADNQLSYTCSFTVSANDTFKVTMTDRAGNRVTQDLIEVDNIAQEGDIKSPEVQINGKTLESRYYNAADETLSLTISKLENESDSVKYKTVYTLTNPSGGVVGGGEQTIGYDAAAGFHDILDLNQDGNWTLKVQTVRNTDETDDRSPERTYTIRVDQTNPTATYTVARANTGTVAKVINALTFGNFFNEAIRITVEATDVTSHAQTLYYEVSGTEGDFDITAVPTERQKTFGSADSNGMSTASFDISPEIADQYIKFKVADNAGNISDLYLAETEKSDLWTLETEAPTIAGVAQTAATGTDPQNRGWNNGDVTVTAAITDASGLETVNGIYKGADDSTKTAYQRPADAADRETSVSLSQTVTAEGTTEYDITARDNAGNESSLSQDENYKEALTRTIRIDKGAPTVTYVGGNPTAWTTEATITFTVHDQKPGDAQGTLGRDYSGVNPMVGNNNSIRVILDGATIINAVQTDYEEATNTYTFTFTAAQNGSYMVYGKDYAGNEGQLTTPIVVTMISTADKPHIPVANPSGDEAKYGSVTFRGSDGSNDYYRNIPDITVTNFTDFVVNSGTDNTTPVNTYFTLTNVTTNEVVAADRLVGYTTAAGNPAPVPNQADVDALIQGADETDGEWKLEVWNVSDTGSVKSDVLTETFLIDTKVPEISDLEEAPGKDGNWHQFKTVTFTVSDNFSGINLNQSPSEIVVTLDEQNGTAGQVISDVTYTVNDDGSVTGSFTAVKRGTYCVNATDYAGNVTNRYSEKTLEILDVSTEKPAAVTVGIAAPTGNEDGHGGNWYLEHPQFVLTTPAALPDTSAPVTTYYKLWHGGASEEPADFTAANTATLDSQEITLDRCDQDGQWNLITKAVSASGVESDIVTRTIYVDTEAPTVDSTPEELKTIHDTGWAKFLNKLTFGLFYNEAIEVTVKVTDVTSYGDRLYYSIDVTGGQTEIGDTAIELTNDPTVGYAKFTLPIGTMGEIRMWATDKAGNDGSQMGKDVKLGYNGLTYWELENTAPQITGTVPALGAMDVSVETEELQLTFDEKVTPVAGKTITILAGKDQYVYTLTEADVNRILIQNQVDPNTTAGVHQPYALTVGVEEFLHTETKDPLILEGETSYVIRVEGGAFKDLATNEITASLVSMFTTGDLSDVNPPKVSGLDLSLRDGVRLYPDFDPDTYSYVIVVTDEALNADKTQLADDLILNLLCEGNVRLKDAVLKDYRGAVIDGDLPDEPTGTDRLKVTVAANLIQSKDNYILELTISDHGKEQTYSFYVSTSAVTATMEMMNSSMPKVTIDTNRLLTSLGDTDLTTYVNRGLKVNIRFMASAPDRNAVNDEILDMIVYRAVYEDNKSASFYPFDFTILKSVSNGEVSRITELDSPIQITVELPSKVKAENVYNVYCSHDGVAAPVPYTLDAEAGTITMTADKFSVYAIAYKTVESGGSGGSGGGGGGGSSRPSGSGGGRITIEGTTVVTNGTWINDGWIFIKSNGQKAANEWISVNGKIYRFTGNGFLDKKYKGMTFAADGSLINPRDVDGPVTAVTGIWMNDGWWYKTVDGDYLKGGWYYLFYQGRFDWYYFDADGWMLDGWFDYNGNRYYLHTAHDTTRGRMYEGWQYIDGKWYYFYIKGDGSYINGTLARSCVTPDGHTVDATGAWDGRGETPVAYTR